MVGRNDQCPCGSGKKYKKCCEGKAQVTVETVFHDEIENTLQAFYSVYPERKDIKDYITVANEWVDALSSLQRDLVEAVALDEFFVHHRLDIWQGFVKRTAKKMVRPATIDLLSKWDNPALFLGKVESVEEDYFTATDALTKEAVRIRRESAKPIPEGMGVFCFTLPDGSNVDNQVLAMSSLIFFPTQYEVVFDAFGKAFAAQSQLDAAAYAAQHHLAFWKDIVKAGYTGEEFTSFEQDVLQQAKDFLAKNERNGEQLIIALEDYLVDQQPTARKAAAIAAGAIRFGQERGLIDGKPFTVKDIAESFGISASSLNKYYQELLAYTPVMA